jgi:hypothetical protein
MRKNFKFNVKYSLFVNENEYPKVEPFTATTSDNAELQCKKMLQNFSDPSCTFKIHSVEKVR